MFSLWIPITLGAAFLQNLRSVVQKQLTGKLSAEGATYVRFLFGLPVAWIYLMGFVVLGGAEDLTSAALSQPPFWAYVMAAAVSQIVATALLVTLFTYRNFAEGTAYSKTETVQAALFGIAFLGEGVAPIAGLGILISLIGVILLSLQDPGYSPLSLFSNLTTRPALLGLASGGLFGIAAVSSRGASLSLGLGDPLLAAATSLAMVLLVQTLLMGGWLFVRDPAQLRLTLVHWRPAALAGITGGIGSIGWFTAMSLQNVAYVRALGQIELVFTFAAGWFLFHEKTNRREVIGVLLIVLGLIVLVLDV